MKLSTKEVIKKHGIRLVKSLGQNFLNDESVIKEIVDTAGIGVDDLVLEVGPGIGNMTAELALRAGKVIAIEIDKHLINPLKENLSEFSNIEIINEDIMKVNIEDIIKRYKNNELGEAKFKSVKVVANLPYYITTPIIMKFLEENPGVDSMIFMVQKEVAERMVANPGGKEYGALSIAVQFYSKASMAFNVPPDCFIPKPAVDSTVIRLDIYATPPVQLLNKDLFFKTVKAAFGQRRKTLVNALTNSGYFNVNKEEIKQILLNIGVGENQRGETLSIMQFAELANAFFQK